MKSRLCAFIVALLLGIPLGAQETKPESRPTSNPVEKPEAAPAARPAPSKGPTLIGLWVLDREATRAHWEKAYKGKKEMEETLRQMNAQVPRLGITFTFDEKGTFEGRSEKHESVKLGVIKRAIGGRWVATKDGFRATLVTRNGKKVRPTKRNMRFVGEKRELADEPSFILKRPAKKWQVEELHVERGRLDDVFRQITAGESGARASAFARRPRFFSVSPM